MPELPEVETVRRILEACVRGRTIRRVERSRHRLRSAGPDRRLPAILAGRTIETLGRHGKFLVVGLSKGWSIVSHLGMSGRWLFFDGDRTPPRLLHVHVKIAFEDGTRLWFQDPRRFGMFRIVRDEDLPRDPSLRILGRDPVAHPPRGADLVTMARGHRVSVKNFLLDQRRIAGIGNIYASEILHRAGVHPARRAGAVSPEEWNRIARMTRTVLGEAIARMGTTFSTYRNVWNEPGAYGERLRVYDRTGEPCRRCATPIRRIVQGQRSTYYCTACQPLRSQRIRRG